MDIEKVRDTSIFALFPHSGGRINWNYTNFTFLRFSHVRCVKAKNVTLTSPHKSTKIYNFCYLTFFLDFPFNYYRPFPFPVFRFSRPPPLPHLLGVLCGGDRLGGEFYFQEYRDLNAVQVVRAELLACCKSPLLLLLLLLLLRS